MKLTLGTFRDYMDMVLVEGRIDDAREEYPDMEQEDFDQIGRAHV